MIVHYYSTYRSTWIQNSDDFIPDRWLSTNSQASELKELLFPFSLGQRACIGQNMATLQIRLIAATILKHFSLALPDDLDNQPEFEYFLTLKTKRLLMKVSHRIK